MARKSKVDELRDRVSDLKAQREEQAAAAQAAAQAPTLDDQIAAAKAELKEATDEANRAAVEALRPKEREQIEQVVKLAGELKAAIEALGVTHREIARYGGYLRAKIAPALWPALRQAEDIWRMYGDGFTTGTMQRPWAPDPLRKVKRPKERQRRLATPGE